MTEMDLDGKNQKIIARGVRNAVGLKWAAGELFATNMGADHLGDDRPEDTLFIIEEGKNYGWPYCYQYRATNLCRPAILFFSKKLNCKEVPVAYAAFSAHSSPLGLEYFDEANADARA